MKEIGRFDTDLQMFVEAPKALKIPRLLFERWLLQSGRGEHFPEGPPTGEIAIAMVIRSNKPIEQATRDALRPQSLREIHMSEMGGD